ncbi:F-box domain-containing protein [Mycena kentingensis (nom. inval.)]|nr:F-box domain-containing protein [Mycena kentingensis (nom. inval.)]
MPPPRTESMSFAALRQQLVYIDNETAALNARLSVLATEREQVVAALKRVVYPIIDIPLELTAEILRHFVSAGNHDVGNRRGTHAALVAASVCGVWRSVALATPALWSTLNLHISGADDKGLQSALSRFLTRSKTHTLAVNIEDVDSQVIAIVLHMLMEHACRIGNFRMRAPLRAEPTLDVERLTHLRKFTILPARRFGLTSRFGLYETSRWSELASSRLTSLSLRAVDTAECLAALRRTSALETLELVYLTGHVPRRAKGVILPHLHTLTLAVLFPSREESMHDEVESRAYAMPLLEQLTLPSLKTLNTEGGAISENFTRLCKLVQRSQCAVAHVSLKAIVLPPP